MAQVQVELTKHEVAWLEALAEVRGMTSNDLLRMGLHRLRVTSYERQKVRERRRIDAWLEAVEANAEQG